MLIEPKVLTIKETAKIIHRSPQRIYELIHSKEIRYIKDGRNYLIPVGEPERWIAAKVKQSAR